MKKCFIVLFVFVLILAPTGFARTVEEELHDANNYLHELDAKINKLKKEHVSGTNIEKMKKLRSEKNATLARIKKLKSESLPAVSSPTVIEKERVIMLPPPPKEGSFGWGILTDLSVGYNGGNSIANARVDWVIPSVFHPKLEYRVGLGYSQGKDISNKNIKAIPVYLGGNVILPIPLPFEIYATGGLNYVAYGSGQKSGSLGGDIGLGIRGDIGLGQPSFIDVGWSYINDSNNYSARGLAINAGTQWMF